MFKTPKRHILARNWVFCVKVSEGPRLWARGRTQKNEHFRSYISPIWGEKPLVRSAQNFALGRYPDVITNANLGDDRLSHFYVARGQILGFSIGFCSRPYNTLALPWECVILQALRHLVAAVFAHWLNCSVVPQLSDWLLLSVDHCSLVMFAVCWTFQWINVLKQSLHHCASLVERWYLLCILTQ